MKKKNYRILAMLVLIMLILAGCGAASKDAFDSVSSSNYSSGSAAEEAADYEYVMEDAAADAVTADSGSGVESPNQAEGQNRKLIKRQYVTMETKEFDELTAFVQEKVNEIGGYIEYSDVSGISYNYSGTRYASYTIRIPVTELDGFAETLKEAGNVTNFSESVEDITLSYVDTESRIAALEAERDTLMGMLEQVGDLDTLLAIQSRLTEVRYQLESYESKLRVYNNDIEYSTVSLEIYEVERETVVKDDSFGSQLKERLSSNFYDLGQLLEGLALFLIGGIPFWILLAVIGVIVIVIVKMVRRRSKKKADTFGNMGMGSQNVSGQMNHPGSQANSGDMRKQEPSGDKK